MVLHCPPQYLLVFSYKHLIMRDVSSHLKKYIVILHNWRAQMPKSLTFLLIYAAAL